ALAVALEIRQPAPVLALAAEEEDSESQERLLPVASAVTSSAISAGHSIAISAQPAHAITVSLDDGEAAGRLKSALADARPPKSVHDAKTVMHALDSLAVKVDGLRHEPMLYSYLLDPTYSSHGLAEIALRRFNLKLGGAPAESADITGRLAAALAQEV